MCAETTLVYSSKSRRKRRHAKALLKDSKLLDAYPGVRVKTQEKMPAVYNAAVHDAEELPDTFSENDIYLVNSSGGAGGSLIALGASKSATMGIVIEINGAYYGTSPQQSRFDCFVEPGILLPKVKFAILMRAAITVKMSLSMSQVKVSCKSS